MTPKTLSRAEAKLVTRHRMLEATKKLLTDKEISAISISEIANAAGISQPGFYSHFASKEEAITEALREEVVGFRNVLTESRKHFLFTASDANPVRGAIRFGVQELLGQIEVLRVIIRHLRSPDPVAEELAKGYKRDFVDDLVQDVTTLAAMLGVELQDRNYIDMVLEGLIGLGEPLLLGYANGTYTDLDQIVELLEAYLRAAFPELSALFNRP